MRTGVIFVNILFKKSIKNREKNKNFQKIKIRAVGNYINMCYSKYEVRTLKIKY